jgi:hypothetical protein
MAAAELRESNPCGSPVDRKTFVFIDNPSWGYEPHGPPLAFKAAFGAAATANIDWRGAFGPWREKIPSSAIG